MPMEVLGTSTVQLHRSDFPAHFVQLRGTFALQVNKFSINAVRHPQTLMVHCVDWGQRDETRIEAVHQRTHRSSPQEHSCLMAWPRWTKRACLPGYSPASSSKYTASCLNWQAPSLRDKLLSMPPTIPWRDSTCPVLLIKSSRSTTCGRGEHRYLPKGVRIAH